MIIFWEFQDFLVYLAKYFWSIWNSPDFIFEPFRGSKVNKTNFCRDLNGYFFQQ